VAAVGGVGLMKALSVGRPWSELILRGKNVENRTWNTRYRGPLLIHAAQSWNPEGVRFAKQLDDSLGAGLNKHTLPTGIVGIAHLTGICTAATDGRPCGCGPWAMPDQNHWQLTGIRRLPEPVPVKGALGLWTATPAVVTAVNAQLDQEASR